MLKRHRETASEQRARHTAEFKQQLEREEQQRRDAIITVFGFA
jgi:hypothetical protein